MPHSLNLKKLEAGEYRSESLVAEIVRQDDMGHLARVFDHMTLEVKAREEYSRRKSRSYASRLTPSKPGEIDLVIPGTIMLSGPDGTRHVTLLERGPEHLTPGRRIVFVYPSTSNPRKVFGMLDQHYRYDILAEIEIPFYLHFGIVGLPARSRESGPVRIPRKGGVPYRTYWLIQAQPKN
jgi:hypothetical protein